MVVSLLSFTIFQVLMELPLMNHVLSQPWAYYLNLGGLVSSKKMGEYCFLYLIVFEIKLEAFVNRKML